jgi:hypothetical protein
MIRLRKMRRVRNDMSVGVIMSAYGMVKSLKKRDHLGYLGIGRRMRERVMDSLD